MNHISLSHEDDNLNKGSIFSRLGLAPLLILRRMPSSSYSAVHSRLPSLIERHMTPWWDLSPFSQKVSNHTFLRITKAIWWGRKRSCWSSWRATVYLSLAKSIMHIWQAKAALYAVSHHVLRDLDEDNGEALINVALFALEVLNFSGPWVEQTHPFYWEKK